MKIENVVDLRNALIEKFNSIEDGTIKPKDATILTHIAGHIISTAKVELKYNEYIGEKKTISFLQTPEQK